MRHPFVGLATLLGGFLTFSQSAQAQGSLASDALSYMRQNPAGTARSLGLAGANVALGADFGNLTSNPAGLGFYTRSEATFTPGFGFGNADASQYLQGSANATPAQSQTANSFHIANAGLVFATRRADNDNSSDWRGGSFALGFTRLADFNQAFRYQTNTDDDHSFFQRLREPYGQYASGNYASNGYQQAATDIFNQYANTRQYGSSQYTDVDGLAYGVGLTDQVKVPNPVAGGDSVYRFATPARNGPITQNELVKTTGSLSQFDLGYGGNYRDKLYIGVGLGIVSLKRTTTSTFQESSEGSPDFALEDYVKTQGTGINARLGLIYRVVDAVRLGASIQTPTYIHLTDDYSSNISNIKFPLGGSVDAQASTAPGTYDYSITTPFRANGGAVFLLGKYGFLSTDIEYVGYKNATFNTTDNSNDPTLDEANTTIKTAYQNTLNYRAGLEGRFDVFRARLGYAYYADPYTNTPINRAQNYFTGGLGVRTKSFFVDAAYVYMTTKDLYSPYSLLGDGAPQVSLNNNRSTVSVTGGLLF